MYALVEKPLHDLKVSAWSAFITFFDLGTFFKRIHFKELLRQVNDMQRFKIIKSSLTYQRGKRSIPYHSANRCFCLDNPEVDI